MIVAQAVKSRDRFRNLYLVLFWPLVLAGCWYLAEQDGFYVAPEFRNWSYVNIMLHSAVIFLYLLKGRRKETNFPFVETLAAFNIVHFGFVVFFIQLEDFQLGVLKVEAMQVAFNSYLLFYSAYYFFMSSRIRIRAVEFLAEETSIKRLKYFGYILLLAYFAGSRFAAIYHLGYVGFFVYLGLFMNFWKSGLLKQWEKLLFIGIILYEFANRALGGLLSPFALLIFFIVLTIFMSRSNKWLIVIALVMFVAFYSIFSSIKYSYRNEVWYGSGGRGLIEKILLIQKLYSQRELDKGVPVIQDYQGRDHFLWRFSYQLSALSMVIEKTPAEVPYWKGESYLPLFSKFIPRFMWEDKPSENMGYRFGTTYGVIRTWNTRTSINTPILPELYMNFGFSGLYLGALFLGFLYFVLARLFNSVTVSYPSKIIGMAIVFPLMIWESNFSLIFGNLLLITLSFILLNRLLSRFVK